MLHLPHWCRNISSLAADDEWLCHELWPTKACPSPLQAYRDNDRIQFQDQQLADHLWQNAGLSQLCAGLEDDEGQPVKLNPNIRVYRYKPGARPLKLA